VPATAGYQRHEVGRCLAPRHREGSFTGGWVDRDSQSLSPRLSPSVGALCSHVLPVKLALSPEQRLSETTCSSVSADYLLCPRRCQIIKHLCPLSSGSQSPRGSLLLRLDVSLYKADLFNVTL